MAIRVTTDNMTALKDRVEDASTVLEDLAQAIDEWLDAEDDIEARKEAREELDNALDQARTTISGLGL